MFGLGSGSSAFGTLLWGEIILIVASGVLATALSRRTDTEAVTD